MRKFKAHKGALLLVAAGCICLYPQLVCADGEPMAISSSDSKVVPTEELGTGTFFRLPFHVSASVRGGYDDNITTSHFDKQESWFTNAGIAVTYDFGSPRTQLSLATNWGFTYYFDPAESDSNDGLDPNLNLSISLTHKATPRLTLSVAAYVTYQAEPDFTQAVGINRRSGNYFFTQDKFTAAYLWTPRFSTATSYTFGAVKYDESSIGVFEDRIENTIGNEFRFLFWPTTTLVGEYRFQVVTYDSINRDSTTHFVLGGFDHRFNPRLNASFRGGAEFRSYDNSTIDDQSSPYFESAFGYALGRNTSVAWTNRYSIEESDTALNPSRQTFRTGIQARHNFTARIAGTLAAYYVHDDYDGISTPTTVSSGFTQESFDVAISVRYAITRNLGVDCGYAYTDVWSDILFQEYSRNRVWAGLNFAF